MPASRDGASPAASFPRFYHRGLLVGGGIIVSIAVIAATAVGMALQFNGALREHENLFRESLEPVRIYRDRYFKSLILAVKSYEVHWPHYSLDQVPVKRYGKVLDDGSGAVTVDPEGPSALTLLASRSRPMNEGELTDALQMSIELKDTPLRFQLSGNRDLSTLVYTTDKRFLASWPPLDAKQLERARKVGSETYIEQTLGNIEGLIQTKPAAALAQERIVWTDTHLSMMTGKLVTQYAIPVYRRGERIAVVVVDIPADRFSTLFMNNVNDEGVMLFSRDLKFLFDPWSLSGPQKSLAFQVAEAIREQGGAPDRRNDMYLRTGQVGSTFFFLQKISGPDWIAVHLMDWHMLLMSLGERLLYGPLLAVGVLAILWIFILLFDRKVLLPLQAQARQVYESDAFSRAVLATAPVGLAVYEPDSNTIVMRNVVAQELFLSQTEGIELFHRLLDGSPFVQAAVLAGEQAPESVGLLETSVLTVDGKQREISVAFAKARYQQREVVVFGLTDISDQKSSLRLLERARQAADQANHAKSMFLAMMSHEIRTPLHGAIGNLELLAMDQLTGRQKQRVVTIRRAFDALLVLINDILDLSKIEAEELHLNPAPFHLDDLVEHCAQAFAPLILDKKLRFLCLIDPALAGLWIGDSHRITQVLMNLLSNARKFTEVGSVTLQAELLDDVEAPESWVRITVSDTGVGIADSLLKRVFEPFVQAERSTASRFGGTGLGLALCQRITGLMGGTISVDSEEGEGSIFTLNLPLVRSDEASELLAPAPAILFRRVLIVCDSWLWQLTLQAQLKGWFPDCEPVEASLERPVTAADPRTVVVFATGDSQVPVAWRAVQDSYLDTLVLSSDGVLLAERRDGVLYLTALSASAFKSALLACGKPDAPSEPPSVGSPLDSPVYRDTRVLIAEDDALNRTLLEHQLLALGYNRVDSVADGRAALERCLANTYDVIVTDLGMPVMDGGLFLKALRARGIMTPVLVSTAETVGSVSLVEESFVEVLYKPITMERLGAALDNALSNIRSAVQVNDSKTGLAMAAVQMRAVFLSGWAGDEDDLRAAHDAGDDKRFLGYLHRLKGALLALSERQVVASCDALRDQVEAQGLKASQEAIDAFLSQMDRLAENYRRAQLVQG